MLASLAFGAVLVSGSLAAVPTASPATSALEAVITQGPSHIELMRRQNDVRYMGWIAYNNTWTSEICEAGMSSLHAHLEQQRLTLISGNTYFQNFQTPGQWACCATTKAGCSNLPIGCLNGNLLYRNLATASSATNSVFTRAWYVPGNVRSESQNLD
jgi:hypothetical protein